MDSPFRKMRPEDSGEASPPPPLYVKYLPQGEIREAWRSAQIPYRSPRPRLAAKRAGVAYQRRIEAWGGLSGFDRVELGPWFCFIDRSGSRHYCQPDLLLFRGDQLLVGEIKLRWTVDAWWQLRHLYLPVLRCALPSYTLFPFCICKSYDPAISIPEPAMIHEGFAKICDPSVLAILVVP